MRERIRALRREYEAAEREARYEALAAVRERFRDQLLAIYAACEAEGGHEWIEERLNDFNLPHLQRHGSTPQRCKHCGKERDVREYSDWFAALATTTDHARAREGEDK